MIGLTVQIALDHEDYPSRGDRARRRELEYAIEDAGLGEVVQAGGGVGVMEIVLRAESQQESLPKLRALLNASGLHGVYRIETSG